LFENEKQPLRPRTSRRTEHPARTMAPRDGPGPFANAIGIAAGITLGGVIVKVRGGTVED
tara:strand:+ start:1961 stop:2140 length:180 start_codon:yes stop_codon:yes gene_type:complete